MMSDMERPDEQAFVDRVSRVLRAPEHFDDDFEQTLVAALRADRPLTSDARPARPRDRRSWWRTPRTVQLSPAWGLALAASLAAVASLGTLRLARLQPAGTATSAVAVRTVHDTVNMVRFVFTAPNAQRVSLVGDFNAWDAGQTPLVRMGSDGAWATTLPVSPGRHEYAFIVDGSEWHTDPAAPATTDDFDTNSSIIQIN
jgi:hypothetical protein